MNILNIPNDLTDSVNKIEIFDYSITSSNVKNKVVLTKNTFSFLLEGTKGIITDETAIKIDKKKFLLIGSGNCLMTENVSEKSIYRSILLFFDNSILSDFCSKIDLSKITKKKHQLYQTFSYDDYICQFVESLIYIKSYNLQNKEKLLKTKFEEIMYYLIDKVGIDFLYTILLFEPDDKKKFINIIEVNKLNNLTIQELAFLCNMSVSTFKRNFTKYYQTSPIKWFLQKRLEYAVYLLNVEKKRPSEIYLKVGFESLSSFIQAFKQKYNITPRQYQARE